MKTIILFFSLVLAQTWAQTVTITTPSSNPVQATVGAPLSVTCQVSAPPSGRQWAHGYVVYWRDGSDLTVGTFSLSNAFKTSGGSVTVNAIFPQMPSNPTNDSLRCSFKTDWNQTTNSPTKQVNLVAGAADTQAPSVPSGLATSNITSSSVTLSWSASTDNVGVAKYQIQTNSNGTLIDVTGATTYVRTGLSASTAYQFRVRACDAAGNCSAYTNNVSATTAAGSTGTPNTVTLVTPSGTSFTATAGVSFNVTCTAYPVSGRVLAQVNLRHYRDGADAVVGSATVNSSNQNGGSFNFTATIPSVPSNGANDTLRCWTATDWNQHQQSINIPVNVVAASDASAPTVPTGLSVTGSTFSSVNLVWSASTDNVAVNRYEVQRSVPTPLTTVLTVNAPALSGTVSSLSPSTAYQFKVRACDAANNCSAYSSAVSVTTPAQPVDNTAPSVPSGLAASNLTSSTVSLNWNASTDNIGVTGYQVSINNGAGIDVTATSYTASGLAPATSYAFKVRAKDTSNNWSAYSTIVNATTTSASGACSATVPTLPSTTSYGAVVSVHAEALSNAIKLCWDQRSGSAQIFRKRFTDASFTSLGTTSSTQYTDSTAVPGVLYEYRVLRESANGYVASGINVPETGFRGKIILAVEQQINSSLSSQLTQLESDLKADGWLPTRILIDRNLSATDARNQIQTTFNTDATNFKALYIVGRIAIPTQAGLNPDGHGELGTRQWLQDSFYAVMNGNTVLQVGRVDFEGMSLFPQSKTDLFIQYFSKARQFKLKQFTPAPSGFMVDKLTQYNLASSFNLTVPGLVRSDIDNNNSAGSNLVTLLNSSGSYLFANFTNYGTYANGSNGLDWTGVNNATTSDYVSLTPDAVFTMVAGSYVCNGNSNNSFLRAPLASAGMGLAAMCGSFVNLYLHQLGMGESIGYSFLQSWKSYNAGSAIYTPKTATTFGTHGLGVINLQGDPTLRMNYVAPATSMQILNSGGNFRFTWGASAAPGIAGYNIYEVTSNAITKLNTSLLSGTSWTSSVPFATGRSFMVRAVALENGAGGSYYNMSLGTFGTY
jgi:chitodextrinase